MPAHRSVNIDDLICWQDSSWNERQSVVCPFRLRGAGDADLLWWQLGLVVARWYRSTKLLCEGPGYSTGMGDRLRAGKPPRFVTSHSGQLSLLPSAGQKMSTSQSAVTLCGWGGGMVHSCSALVDKRVGYVVKLCDPSLTHAIPDIGSEDE